MDRGFDRNRVAACRGLHECPTLGRSLPVRLDILHNESPAPVKSTQIP